MLMPQRNTEALPCRRGSEFAVADRYPAPQFMDVNSSLLQRDHLQLQSRRELLQAKEDQEMKWEKIQEDLLRQDRMYYTLLREEELLRRRRLESLDPYHPNWDFAQRRIAADIQDVQWKKRLLEKDVARINQYIRNLRAELERLHLDSLPVQLSSSAVRPESASIASRFGDFDHSMRSRAHTPVPLPRPMRQQSAPLQSPSKGAKPDTFDRMLCASSQMSQTQGLSSTLPLLPSGHFATQPLTVSGESPKIPATSPVSSPHSLAPVTNVASATVSTEATLQDTVMLPDLSDPLSERLQEHELQELQVLGDGNCQFRAIADQLAPYYSQECHDNVRAAIVQQLRRVPDRYRPFVTEDYDEWVDRMAADKEWGNEVTLRAAADAFGVEIHVFADNLGDGQLYSAYEPVKKNMNKVIRLVFRSVRGDSGHYNSVESYKKGFSLR